MGAVSLLWLITGSLTFLQASGAFGGDSNKVLLRDISVLTLYHGQMANSRRSSPIPQMKCVGGSAGCGTFTPQVVQCYNRGFDGYDVQWECKTDMDNAYRFGKIEVSCEGYDYPDDSYVLRGSCGLEYTLDLTKEGYQQQGSRQHSYYGGGDTHHPSHHHHKSSGLNNLIFLAIIVAVVYAIYKTCLSSPAGAPYPPGDSGHAHRGGFGPSAPPPPGFRSDYMPPGGGCSSSFDSTHTHYTGSTPHTSAGGGFWTGAATGGILGYLFGNRSSGGYAYPRHHTGWGSGWGSSGWGNSGWGASTADSWGGSSSSYGSGGGGGSTGTRTASGFGGTKRR